MHLFAEAKRLLRVYRVSPRRRLGQNFTIDSLILQRMIAYAGIGGNDVVLEVGAGLGFLTRLLSPICKRVLAVEVDPKLADILRDQLRDLRNVRLIEGDVLKVSIPSFNKVVSTPPYVISSPLLFWLFERGFDLAVLAFQRAFARRLAAQVGSRDYGRLTVTTYYRANVELLEDMPKEMFFPPPEVDSIIVRLKLKQSPPFRVEDEQAFSELVQAVFTQRNRKMRHAVRSFLLKRGVTKEEAQKLADSLTFHHKRVRDLAPEDFGALTNEILEKTCLPQ